jgi:hypothetical protein
MALRLQFPEAGGTNMLRFLKQLFFFRVGQRATRGVARSIGLGSLAGIAGIIGGVKYMRKHA